MNYLINIIYFCKQILKALDFFQMLKNWYIFISVIFDFYHCFHKNNQQNMCSGQQGTQDISKDVLGSKSNEEKSKSGAKNKM